MVSMLFRDPRALSSTLASLGMPWAFGSLNHIETLESASNYYLCNKQCSVGREIDSIDLNPQALVQ